MKMKTVIQNPWDTAAVLRVYSNTILLQETRKISNNLTLQLKQLDKEKQNPKLVEEIIMVRAEINEIEMKKTKKINETKSWFFEKIKDLSKSLVRLIMEKRGCKSIKLEMKN